MARKPETTRDRLMNAAEPLIMAQGFAGTSLDDILAAAGLTKGAFFHHFKGKGELARALIERHAVRDVELFERLEAEARAKARNNDPLEQTLLFLEGFEQFVSSTDITVPGCIYAAYTYESMQFEPAIRDLVADSLRKWTSIYVRRFQEILDLHESALPVTARELAEMIVSIIEGGFVLQRAYGDPRLTARQSQQFRNYLKLLFDGRTGKAGKAGQQAPRRRASAKAYA
jgi:TetR/AcrR family transcriptional repressor of nem operon